MSLWYNGPNVFRSCLCIMRLQSPCYICRRTDGHLCWCNSPQLLRANTPGIWTCITGWGLAPGPQGGTLTGYGDTMCCAHFLKKAGPEPPSKTQNSTPLSESKFRVEMYRDSKSKSKELFDKGHAHNISNKNKNAHIREKSSSNSSICEINWV